ncbi:MAG TPA: SLC13 family permease [Burkholderiales bacterium]|jgi:di/tricarboxylate transporter/CRP-like cAMP-binding protein|nr:SLC13 family permease [Burkholderiales bacterium]
MSAVLPDPAQTSATAWLIDLLKHEPIISRSSYESLSRLLPHVSRVHLKAGQPVYRAGTSADVLYYVASGSVNLYPGGGTTALAEARVSEGHIGVVTRGYVGEEAILGSESYMADAVAAEDAELVLYPREHFNVLLTANPAIRAEYFVSLMNRFSQERLTATPGKRGASGEEAAGWSHVIGWLLAIVLPPAVYFGIGHELDVPSRLYLGIFTATVVMWVFRLTADFIPGIFAVAGTLVFDLVPQNVILSGFASDGFFMALSILGLSAVITSSGLSYRLMLWVLKSLPATKFWTNFGIMATGMLLSPVVPSINGRVAMVTPLLIDMTESLKYKFKGPAATRLAMSAFNGVGVLSAVFLTSKSANFVIYGLLPAHAQEEFSWFHWMYAGLVCGVVMVVLNLVLSAIFFRTDEKAHLSKEVVAAQLHLLGPMRSREWASLFGIAAFGIGVVTASIHQIQPPWVALLLLYFLLAFNYLRGSEFRDKIDWPFLIYFAGLVGMVSAMSYLGLTKYLAGNLAWLGDSMRTNFPAFLLILSCVMFALRLVAPNNAVIAVSATVLMPLADLNGVNPWVIGFIILTMSEHWFFPYQCTYYVQFEELTKRKRTFNEKSFITYNALTSLLRLAGLYASIPFWRSLGLL